MLINRVNQAPIVSTQSSNFIQQEKSNANRIQPFGPAATFQRSDKADYDTNKLSGTQKSIMNIQEQIAQVKTDDTMDEGMKQSRIEALEEQLQNLEMQLSQEQMEKANPKNKEKDADHPLNATAEETDPLKDANPLNDNLSETASGLLSITQNANQMELTKTTMGAAEKAERHVRVLQSEIKLDRNPSDGKMKSVLDAKQQAQEASVAAQKMMERSGEMIQDSARPNDIAETKGADQEIHWGNTNSSNGNGQITGDENSEEAAARQTRDEKQPPLYQ